jgi:hypothetical protein
MQVCADQGLTMSILRNRSLNAGRMSIVDAGEIIKWNAGYLN